MLQRKRQNLKKNSVKILQLMLKEIISRLSLKQRQKLLNFNKCSLLVKLLLIKRFKWNKSNLLESQLYLQNQSNKKRMMVMWKLLKK